MKNQICKKDVITCDGCLSCLVECRLPICPICDKEAGSYFYDSFDRLIGCNRCIVEKSAGKAVEVA
ncbi:MAG: hypothetical protein FWB93_02875 [Oscillospiraceae bacterium]|nr:hypothetical protein [Oscillospiraceae bacterium]